MIFFVLVFLYFGMFDYSSYFFAIPDLLHNSLRLPSLNLPDGSSHLHFRKNSKTTQLASSDSPRANLNIEHMVNLSKLTKLSGDK